MDKIELKGRAKINLSLDVIRKREDGYHEVAMIMQQIDLYDVIKLEKTPSGIWLDSDCDYIPLDNRNIAFQAAEKMIERFDIKSGVKITLDKKIPVAAGLAGGSTDAATVLKGMVDLFELEIAKEELMAIGKSIGADVPFCIMGGAALAEGIGESLTPIKGMKHVWILLVKPNVGVSTKDVYGNLNIPGLKERPDTEVLLKALEDEKNRIVCDNMVNVLESVTIKMHPIIKDIKLKLKNYGAQGVMMSGSGPTVFSIFNDYDKAKKAEKNMKRYYKQSFLVRTYNGGENV